MLVLFSLLAFLFTVRALRQIFEFPNGTFVENIAVRSNGQLLLTITTSPTIFTLDPASPPASLLYTFPNATTVSGITELAPDIFAVNVGTISPATNQGVPGTFGIWTLDLRHGTVQPIVKKLVSIPESMLLNGLTAVQHDVLLASDSALGVVWTVNTAIPTHGIAIQDPLTAPTDSVPFGINGLRVLGRTLYFSNTAQGFYGRVPINGSGFATGEIEILAHLLAGESGYDDFALDTEGTAWIAVRPNEVNRITARGEQSVIANSTEIVNPTSGAFGRGSRKEERTLYVTTASGQVFAIDAAK